MGESGRRQINNRDMDRDEDYWVNQKDVPIYPAVGLYPSVDSYVLSRSVPSVLGASHVQQFQGYADLGSQ
ncbi:hypothetical protein L1987_57151 [Smallanthus sonchifolius]|uniref:Uncharacterized protein n=1 Tax=Smallanthus sonchifolius TaxID=185202 RepID=A0ACB9DCF9_9ASTR|nr:hypothetical protein L1987_57151 [Smallanthus sonchifolius]